MRALPSFVIGLLTATFFVAAIILVVQNDKVEQITFWVSSSAATSGGISPPRLVSV